MKGGGGGQKRKKPAARTGGGTTSGGRRGAGETAAAAAATTTAATAVSGSAAAASGCGGKKKKATKTASKKSTSDAARKFLGEVLGAKPDEESRSTLQSTLEAKEQSGILSFLEQAATTTATTTLTGMASGGAGSGAPAAAAKKKFSKTEATGGGISDYPPLPSFLSVGDLNMVHVVLLTHILQRILVEGQHSTTAAERGGTGSAEGFGWLPLFALRTAQWTTQCGQTLKLEKAVQRPGARSALGRGLLSATVAAVASAATAPPKQNGQESDHDDDDGDDDDDPRSCFWSNNAAACLALDKVLSWQLSTSLEQSSSISEQDKQFLDDSESSRKWRSEYWKQVSSRIEEALELSALSNPRVQASGGGAPSSIDWSREKKVWELLVTARQEKMGAKPGATAAAAVSPKVQMPPVATKRAASRSRRTRNSSSTRAQGSNSNNEATATGSGTAAANSAAASSTAASGGATSAVSATEQELLQNLAQLLRQYPQHYSVAMDGRLASRRWSSVSLVWLLNGQERMVQAMTFLLESEQCSGGGDVPLLQHSSANSLSMPRRVVTEAMVGRTIRLLLEAGNACGSRPPTGGVEAYVRSLSNKRIKAPPSKAAVRSDIRSPSLVLMYQLLQTHYDCLSKVESTSEACLSADADTTAGGLPNMVILNHSDGSARLPDFFPFVKFALNELARAASSSYGTYSDHIKSAARMQAVGAARAAQLVQESQPRHVVDASLLHWVVSRLGHCLEEEIGSNLDSEWISLEVDKPLPLVQRTQTQQAKKKRKKNDDVIPFLTGFFPAKQLHQKQEELALFLRAMSDGPSRHPRGRSRAASTSGVNSQANRLLSLLVDIGCSCCSPRSDAEHFPVSNHSVDTAEPTRKRKVATATTSRRKKQKRQGNKKVDEPCTKTAEPSAGEKIISKGCCVLATAVFKSLAACLTKGSFHSVIKCSYLVRLIGLGFSVEQFTKKTQLLDEQFEAVGSSMHKHLWTAYGDLCTSIGGVLGDHRLNCFQQIASSKSVLWLSVPHRRLICANILSESPGSEDSEGARAPDLYLVQAFINGLSEALGDLHNFFQESKLLLFEDSIPLSLSSARVFAAVLMRLSEQDQLNFLSKLLVVVKDGLSAIKKDTKNLSGECSSFVARVVSLCASITIALTCSQTLPHKLVELTRVSQPSHTSSTQSELQSMQEKCFVSLFEGSTDFLEPDLTSSSIGKEESDTLQWILSEAFTLSFNTAHTDKCHLMMAAWINLGKSGLWQSQNSPNISYEGLPATDDLPKLIVELRDEMCYVHRLICLVNGDSGSTGLLRVINGKNHLDSRARSVVDVRKNLKAMIVKASKQSEDLLSHFSTTEDVPPQVFCLLEELSVYLAYALSAYTTSGKDFFTYLQSNMGTSKPAKRGRGYSTESDNYPSSDTDSRDLALEAADRLETVCSAFGAVPSHPDWLDCDCKLWESIDVQDAQDAAVLAMENLSKLACIALGHAQVSKSKALKQLSREKAEKAEKAETSLFKTSLCRLLPHHLDTGKVGERVAASTYQELVSDISTIMEIDKNAAMALWFGEGCRTSRQLLKENWIRSAAQRVRGSLQEIIRQQLNDVDCAELRASGEWEVLLTLTLTSCGMAIPDEEQALSPDAVDHNALLCSERWHGVYHAALHAMAPAAALLNLSLRLNSSLAASRKAHPLKLVDYVLEDSFDALSLAEPIPLEKPAPQSVQQAVGKTLSLLSTCMCLGMGPEELLCKAIAANLVTDSTSFLLLKGVTCSRIVLSVLSRLAQLSESRGLKLEDESTVAAAAAATTTELGLLLLQEASSRQQHDISCLKLAFGAQGEQQNLSTIAQCDIGVEETLSYLQPFTTLATKEEALALLPSLVSFIWPDNPYVNQASRLLFVRTLCMLAVEETLSSESPQLVVAQISKAFDSVSQSRMALLVERDIIGSVSDCEEASAAPSAPTSICTLLACILPKAAGKTRQIIYDTLKNMDLSQEGAPAMNLLCLLASCCTELHLVGSQLIDYLRNGDNVTVQIENLSIFSAFLHEMRSGASPCTEVDELSSHSKNVLLCSHAEKTGFRDQHWYHCYSCGLIEDKGCCRVCALVCHDGHDVSYSRYSAFFCDCGAEGRKCKCLTAISLEKENDDDSRIVHLEESLTRGGNEKRRNVQASHFLEATIARLARLYFNKEEMLEAVVKKAREGDWKGVLFQSLKNQFLAYSKATSLLPSSVEGGESSYDTLQCSLLQRKASTSIVKGSGNGNLKPFLNFKQGTFDVSADRILLSNLGTGRNAMEADSRARLLISDGRSLLFCTLLPVLKASNQYNSASQSRDSVVIIGKELFDFNIVGMNLCRTTEQSLIVWGPHHQAVICTLNECGVGFHHKTELDLGLGSLESGTPEFVCSAEFLPGCSCAFFVVCRRSIFFFSKGSETASTSLSPETAVKLGAESFRGVVARCNRQPNSWTLFVLLEDGHLHSFELGMLSCGKLRVNNLNLDPKQSIKLPVHGSSGEGSHLCQLHQSNLVLYQSSSSPCIAISLDMAGNIRSSFILLPDTISKELVGSHSDLYPVRGPYTNFVELGAIQHGSSAFFRLVCLGRRSGNSVLLCVDFNHNETRVAELSLESSNFPSNSTSTPVGLVSFSAPFTQGNPPLRDLRAGAAFSERAFLVLLLSDGSLHVLGEEQGTKIVSSPSDSHPPNSHWFPPSTTCLSFVATNGEKSTNGLHGGSGTEKGKGRWKAELLAFEQLTNLSESENLSWIAYEDSMGSQDDIQKQLHRDSDGALTSPGPEGLTVSVRVKNEKVGASSPPGFVMVAFRIQVGATSLDSIPKSLRVASTSLDLQPQTAKWYCVHLTAQEIAHALRNGFVTIRAFTTYDTLTSPKIDSIEVFGVCYSQVECWVPTALTSSVTFGSRGEDGMERQAEERRLLFLCVRSFARLLELLQPLGPLLSSEQEILQQLIEGIVLEEDSSIDAAIISILATFIGEEDAQEFQDKAIVRGCSSILSKCQQLLAGNHQSLELTATVKSKLLLCLRKLAALGKARPLNYSQVDNLSPGSRASKVIGKLLSPSMELIVPFVELCLVETAVASRSSGAVTSGKGLLRTLLLSNNLSVVSISSSAISKFLKQHSATPPSSGDLFATVTMRVFYQCDGCQKFPIKDFRFSLLDDASNPVDLCQQCYESAKEYASTKQYNDKNNLLLNGGTVGEGVKLTCADVKKLQSIKIHCDSGDEAGVEGDKQTVKRKQLFDDFIQRLFSEVLFTVQSSSCTGAQSVAQLARLAVEIAVEYSSGVSQSAHDRARRLGKELVLALSHSISLAGKDVAENENSKLLVSNICILLQQIEKLSRLNAGGSLWNYFSATSQGKKAVESKLCDYIQHLLVNQASTISGSHPDQISSLVDSSQNLFDGVLCCVARLRNVPAQKLLPSLIHDRNRTPNSKVSVIEASFSLLSLIAQPGDVAASWPPLLCEVILTSEKSSAQRDLAKKCLYKLCGGRKGLYTSTRAHFTFSFYRDKLIPVLADALGESLVVKEKARQCGNQWKTRECLQITNLRVGDLIGTEDLLSEDVVTARTSEEARKILSEVTIFAKKKPDHWRRFLGLGLAPKSKLIETGHNDVLRLPPVVLLAAASILLRDEAQIKASKLLDLALSTGKKQQKNHGEGKKATSKEAAASSFSLPSTPAKQTPEQILGMTIDNLFAFVVRFGCHGRTAELRSLSCSIALKVSSQSSPSMSGQLFQRLVHLPISKASALGKSICEVLTLLQGLLSHIAETAQGNSIDIPAAAALLQSYWKSQMHAIRYDRSNHAYYYFETRSGNNPTQRKRFELSPCIYCQQEQIGRKDKSKPPGRSQGDAARPSRQTTGSTGNTNSRPWHPEQVTVYSRGRLEGWRESFVSDEFNSYSSFKYRLLLAEIHLEINDPRGRFVKTITVYISPRPISDVAQLKSQGYTWQRCGCISLAKGASRGSCKLDMPVVASNIRLEYTDFYERPGSSRTTEGSFIVHCPRCTRIVTNAHGVCGACGEVAFQCRKCRHINYDRLDAFLCAECGYCASGGYVYELTAAISTNAISIRNDRDYERSCRMYAVASRLYDDLRTTLQETLCVLLKKPEGNDSAQLARAFSGAFPLDPSASGDQTSIPLNKLGKQGSVVKAVARPDNRVFSSRAQSLLRLTREWRESTSAADARRSGDVIIHHLGRDSQVEDEDSELFGLLEGSVLRSGDDSLSRLIASVQSRRERRAAIAASAARGDAQDHDRGNENHEIRSPNKSKPQLTKESLDICDRLYVLMREAERESHLLEQRITAWRCLETDSLGQQGSAREATLDSLSFEPSHCSACASTVANRLLTLWLSLLEADPDGVAISKDIIHLLLSDEASIVHKTLQDTKRRALKSIALKSKQGSPLVLAALKLRLQALDSVPCAEILASIVEEGGPPTFRELAMEVLETSTAMDLS